MKPKKHAGATYVWWDEPPNGALETRMTETIHRRLHREGFRPAGVCAPRPWLARWAGGECES